MALDHDKASDNAAMTLMSTDLDGIVAGTRMFIETTACAIETLVGIGLLSIVTGAASFLVIVPTIGIEFPFGPPCGFLLTVSQQPSGFFASGLPNVFQPPRLCGTRL